MGGFSGNAPVYSVTKLKELVKTGKVKYFLISDRGGMGGQSSDVIQWIKQNGTEIRHLNGNQRMEARLIKDNVVQVVQERYMK